ncbi:hypothetical protein DEJ31_07310 [Curtobacterium sp. MCPF17_031]|nr:hypothetical protein DEJ31_07310 [Curtobacterium sp. MCPF17_031]
MIGASLVVGGLLLRSVLDVSKVQIPVVIITCVGVAVMGIAVARAARKPRRAAEATSGSTAPTGKQYDPHRAARVRLLLTEMDKRMEAAIRRGAGFDTKAGFMLTAAGLIAASSAVTATSSTAPALARVPTGLALLAVAAALWALWTRMVNVPDARSIVSGYVNRNASPEHLEDVLLEVRTQEVEAREAHNSHRAEAVTVGFVMLAAAVVALLVFVAVAPQQQPPGAPDATPTPTPAATERR